MGLEQMDPKSRKKFTYTTYSCLVVAVAFAMIMSFMAISIAVMLTIKDRDSDVQHESEAEYEYKYQYVYDNQYSHLEHQDIDLKRYPHQSSKRNEQNFQHNTNNNEQIQSKETNLNQILEAPQEEILSTRMDRSGGGNRNKVESAGAYENLTTEKTTAQTAATKIAPNIQQQENLKQKIENKLEIEDKDAHESNSHNHNIYNDTDKKGKYKEKDNDNSSTNNISDSNKYEQSSNLTIQLQNLSLPKIKTDSALNSFSTMATSKDQDNIHIVFSTSCHIEQDWQSYLFFYQAMIHNQLGTVTRIVSGCSYEAMIILSNDFKAKIATMSDRFHIHFTPDYGSVPRKNYQDTKYWNKPFGFRHWLEKTFGYDYGAHRTSTLYDDHIIVLLDPDMLLQRQFINHFPQNGHIKDTWIPYLNRNNSTIYEKVSHGKPMAQVYAFGAAWFTTSESNLTYVVGPDSFVHNISKKDARLFYSAGPPYIATAQDMYQIAYYWTKFLPKIFRLFPKFMAEMYAYCMAAAHLGLKHQLAQGFMISDAAALHGEGWAFMDGIMEMACDVQQFRATSPHVIHFCQQYSIDKYFFSKYLVPASIFSCDFPLLDLPSVDIAKDTNSSHHGNGTIIIRKGNEQKLQYRNAFMVCSLLSAINNAATFFKDHHCPNGANYNKTWNAFRADKELEN